MEAALAMALGSIACFLLYLGSAPKRRPPADTGVTPAEPVTCREAGGGDA
jgi:hypothetical protein